MGFMTSKLNQTAVVWPTPTKDVFGKLSYGTPVEISVRWEYKRELFLNAEGKEELSMAVVWTERDMTLEEYLYLGNLSDLSTAEKADPQLEDQAFPIKAYSKIPNVNATDFERKVWL